MMSMNRRTPCPPHQIGVRRFHSVRLVAAIVIAGALIVPVTVAQKSEANHVAATKSSATVPDTVLFIPASAHVAGALGTNWRTDLELHNPGQAEATVTLSLLRARESNSTPSQRTYDLGPGESLRFEDVLTSVFGFDGAAALRITNDVGMVAVTSRTYNLTDDGTYGQFVGGVINHTAIQSGQEGRIIQLTHNRSSSSGFRTNIGFVNAIGSQITVRVTLYRADGSSLGSLDYTLAPFEFRQIDKIFQKVTGDDVDNGYAVLTTTTAGGAFFAYGVVIDNRTSDPIYVTPANRASSGVPPGPTATPTPTTSSTVTPSPTPTPTPTPSAESNLAPYQPDGWSDPLVVSGTTGTNTSGGLTGGGATYFDWAVANYGPDDAMFPAGSNIARVLLDSATLVSFYSESPYTLTAGHYAYYEDYEVTGIAAGSHTATLVGDPDNEVPETDEGDNTFDYVGMWSAKSAPTAEKVAVPKARLRIAPIPGWRSSSTSNAYHPIGVRWQGPLPLRPGPLALDSTKQTTTPDTAIYIAAAAHVAGALDTNWRTDVELHNPGATRARVQVAMLVRGQANPAPQTRTFTVNAGTSLRLEDILSSSFDFTGAAALRITILEGDIIATSRTYNLTDVGTYGQFAASVHGSQAFVTGERALLMQLTHDASTTSGFRTNVGMVNLSGSSIVLDLDFRAADGTSYGTVSYTLEPYEFIQKDKIFKQVTSGTVDDGYIVITSSSAGARFLAYATVIDNRTADSIFIPAISVLASEPTPASFIPAAEAAFAGIGLLGQGNLPNIETLVAGVQTLGMQGFIASMAALMPPGSLTPIANGWRADLGSHFVLRTGDIVAGSITGTYVNLVNEPGQLSYDYEITGENVLWNGQYAEIGGATGEVDLTIDSGSHVTGGVTMQSFAMAPKNGGKIMSVVSVTGSAEFNTAICPNYPISGSVTFTRNGESQTISFTNSCDGTFEGGSQGQTGDVAFRLTWNGPQDLDLYVKEPNGTLIWYGNKGPTSTEGQLDVDSNAGCSGPDQSPTENVFWPVGKAPHGTYEFYVRRWSECGATSTPSYTLRVFEGETVVKTLPGTMPESGETQHYFHEY